MKLWKIKLIIFGLMVVTFLLVTKLEFNTSPSDMYYKGMDFLDLNAARGGYHRVGSMYISFSLIRDLGILIWFFGFWGRKKK